MAVLIDLRFPEWLADGELRDELAPLLPGVDIRVGAAPGERDEVEMLIVSNDVHGSAARYPNLSVLQKTGAGVENILSDPLLPGDVRVCRSSAYLCVEEMAEYSLGCVLDRHRHFDAYRDQQAERTWRKHKPPRSADTTVAVLGLGRMGTAVARRFAINGFSVLGWSSTAKSVEGVECVTGADGLDDVLARSRFVVAVLPTTAETAGMFDERMFAPFNPDAVFINIGRGDQVVESDLLAALAGGRLGGAVLDVMCTEPLQSTDPLWSHPRVTVTPHISGWHSYEPADLASNYERLRNGEPLLHVVDRARGY